MNINLQFFYNVVTDSYLRFCNNIKGGTNEFHSSRIHHRRRLFPASIDCWVSGCRVGSSDGYCAQSLQTVTLFLLPATGVCGVGGDLYRNNRELLNTSLERLECWSGGVLTILNLTPPRPRARRRYRKTEVRKENVRYFFEDEYENDDEHDDRNKCHIRKSE